jgi:hypothetical protein
MTAHLEAQPPCPPGGMPRRTQGEHARRSRTSLGPIPVKSPRLPRGAWPPHATKTCSPLAEGPPEHLTPEWLFLATQWAPSAA